ncbi:MAG: nucleoside-diphosphate-sugar epimerase [Myxococcota bacterium]|jgi:nucleoside-diphosphate-sugar epimerase
MTPTIDTSTPVLVTGATGYVAGRVVEKLLAEGVTVHATVRDPSKTDRLKYLTDLADAHPGTLKFFGADLIKPGSFAEAMAGCGVVFHIASPFASGVKNPQRDLVDPAVNGTRNVLEQANDTPSVSRVVVTSSCAAIYGDNIDLDSTPNGEFTEDVWNTTSSLAHNAYSFSKTLAEKEAWAIHDAQDRWKLVTVNPSFVLGPGIRIHSTSESFTFTKQLGDGTLGSGAPGLCVGVVDVRDLATAHVNAGFLPDANGRNIISGHNTNVLEMATTLQQRFGAGFPIPTRTLPKFLLWLIGPFVNSTITRRFVSRSIGRPWVANNSKSQRELGVSYRPLSETMNDFFQQLVDEAVLTAK